MSPFEKAALWATRNAENGIPTSGLAGRALLEVEARLRRDIAHLRLSIAQLQQAVLELQQQVRVLREAAR